MGPPVQAGRTPPALRRVLVPATGTSSLRWGGGDVSLPGSAGSCGALTPPAARRAGRAGLPGGRGHRPSRSCSGAARCSFRAPRASWLFRVASPRGPVNAAKALTQVGSTAARGGGGARAARAGVFSRSRVDKFEEGAIDRKRPGGRRLPVPPECVRFSLRRRGVGPSDWANKI